MPRSSDGMSEMRCLTTWAVSCSHCFFIEEIALDSSCVLKYRLKRGSVVSACAKSVCVTLVKRNDGGIFIMKAFQKRPIQTAGRPQKADGTLFHGEGSSGREIV